MVVVIAAVSVLSCTKTVVSTDDIRTTGSSIPRISFSPSASGMSKALLTPDNFAVEGTQIKVNDLYTTHEDIWSVAGEAKNEFIETYIDDKIAEYYPDIADDGSVSQWNFKDGETTYKDYYWTPTGTHYFSAYTWKYNNGVKDICLSDCLTCNESAASDNTESDNPTFSDGLTYNPRLSTLTIKNWELTQDTQFDFCYAVHERSMSGQNPYRPVELQMQHLFAAIQFNVINLILNEKINLDLLSVSGLSNNGCVTILEDGALYDMATDTGIGKGYSSPSRGSLEYNKPHNAFAYQGATDDSKNSKIGKDGCILVWPHDSDKLKNAQARIKTSWTGEKVFGLFIEDRIEQWQAGRKYVYTIEIADNRISFNAVVVPWVTDDVTLEDR